MSEDLKPCPFCGGEAEFIGGLPKNGYDRVSCRRCFSEVDGDDKGKAIAAWNTRAATDAAALEEAAGAVAELVEGLRGLERTMQELLDACGRAGAFDNVVAQFFPDKETRGTRAEDGYKRIDRARNEAKAQADFARALITKHEEPK